MPARGKVEYSESAAAGQRRLLGHTLGLGHPDQATSIHSTTSAADWASAAMTSSVPPSQPSAPQADDIQAILWYYGAGVSAPTERARPSLSTHPTPRLPLHLTPR